MKKLKLHDFHKMEIDKQNQSMLKGGVCGCICVGYACGCMCSTGTINIEDGLSYTNYQTLNSLGGSSADHYASSTSAGN